MILLEKHLIRQFCHLKFSFFIPVVYALINIFEENFIWKPEGINLPLVL